MRHTGSSSALAMQVNMVMAILMPSVTRVAGARAAA
jgi:hypothetical protein